MKLLTTLAALLVAGSVAAQDKPAAPPGDTTTTTPITGTATAAPSSSSFYEGTNWGLQIDAGAPAGVTAALVYRPWQFLRVNAGVGYDVVAFGVKGGVTLIPFHWGVVPTLGLEAGHFFEGDLNSVVNISDPVAKILTKQLAYDYVTADLGIEFGAQNRFVFYIRAGMSQVWANMKNLGDALNAANSKTGVRYTAKADPSGEARGPSARIGFILYLF